ncbi:MAG: permease-like cell division protein FtsX [Eubacteriales bacterium]|nr:permease-like cell division protein FtsX [Eubacteriales bacterium]
MSRGQLKSKGLRYAFKDGFVSLRRHPLILLASITTMTLMLYLLSIFMAFALNVVHLINIAGQQPPIEIQFQQTATPGDVAAMEQRLASDKRVLEKNVSDPEANFIRFKKQMGEEELYADFDYHQYIPYTIQVRLEDPAEGAAFKEEYSVLPGVREILMEDQLMGFLQKAIRSVSLATSLVFIALAIISCFIIANMVRVAILSRSVEISIMKYMGATNLYIRIPFVVEGIVVGIVSAILAIILGFFTYETLLLRFDPNLATSDFHLLTHGKILPAMAAISFTVGILLGGISSGASVRKHIQV